MLSQLTKSTCPRHSRIHLRWNGRECGRFIHQTSSNTEAPKVHGGSRAAPVLKKSYLGFIHFNFSVRAGQPLPGYGSTLSPAKQSLSGVLMRLLVISLFHYFIISLFYYFIVFIYLPTGRRKRGKCCINRPSAFAPSAVVRHARLWCLYELMVSRADGQPC